MTTQPLSLPALGGVLVASPSVSFREKVRQSFDGSRGPVQEVQGGADALMKLESGGWQLLLLDRRLPDLDAEELIQIIRRRFPFIEVVLVDSDLGHVPENSERAESRMAWRALPVASREGQAQAAGKPVSRTEPLPGMIGDSEPMQRLYRLTRLVAPRDTSVLILGPTGSGKELVARALHRLSPRAGRSWVAVNCAAIPETLVESELFGYARGAFTGAGHNSAGRIQLAQGGTLFLDEIGELPLGLQAKLLRFLEQKEIQRLGSPEIIRVDVRVVAATNARLWDEVEQGRFRADLYYRLATFPLEIPSLGERPQDILPLAEHFLRILAPAQPAVLTAESADRLQHHRWSGNVRELGQVMERALILAEGGGEILPEHLHFAGTGEKRLCQPPVTTAFERNLRFEA